MPIELPHNSDGDTLRRLIATGSDLSKEMVIDFAVVVPDQEKGIAFAAVVEPLGFKTKISQDVNSRVWTCICTRVLVPEYGAIMSIQEMLDELGRPFDARPDGWNTFGNLPFDSDGAALRRLIADGSDLSKEMEIDFAVAVPDEEKGTGFAAVVKPLGYKTNVHQDDESGEWTCYCTRVLVPTYDEMISIQQMLEELGRPFDARPDGWGSFGNSPVPPKPPAAES